jgi:signal transduction histidine kinase
MSPRDLLRSTPLRLAAIFSLSIVILTGGVFAFVYQATTQASIAELKAVFADEAEKAAASDDQRLQRALSLRLTRDFRRLNYVAVYDAAGKLVFGNLERRPDIPLDGKTHYLADFQVTETADPEPTLMVARARPDNGVIVLGRSLSEVATLRRILARALAFAILPIAIGSLAAGFMLARRNARRIGEIERSIARIMRGGLDERLPGASGIDELDGVIASINRMLDGIERLLGQLAAVGDNIAHDLKAPLVNIRAALEQALAATSKEAPARKPIKSALQQIDRASATVAALLRMSAIERESRHSAFDDIDLAAICAELHGFFLPLAEAKGIRLLLTGDGEARLRGDADLMREAVANLIDNALKFTPRGGEVRVAATGRDGGAALEVSDNGRGVPFARDREIFRRFTRAEGGKDLPGVGLGLNIAATIAHLHGMDLAVADNAPGARFTMAARPSPMRLDDNI